MASNHKSLSDFRNCFEAGMDFDTALGCAGVAYKGEEVVAAFREIWSRLEAASEAA